MPLTESISYRLKDEEIPKHWDKSMDKIIEVNLRRIARSKSGKAVHRAYSRKARVELPSLGDYERQQKALDVDRATQREVQT